MNLPVERAGPLGEDRDDPAFLETVDTGLDRGAVLPAVLLDRDGVAVGDAPAEDGDVEDLDL